MLVFSTSLNASPSGMGNLAHYLALGFQKKLAQVEALFANISSSRRVKEARGSPPALLTLSS